MPRTLSSAIQTVLAGTTQRVCHLLSFTVGATAYRFTDGDSITFQGNFYKPHLTLESGARYTEKLQLEPVTVKLQNIDLQTAAMLKTEGVTLEITDDAVEALARFCQKVNEESENIGARRLHTIMEYLLEDISFEAPERDGAILHIDSNEVERRLAHIVESRDLSKYIL